MKGFINLRVKSGLHRLISLKEIKSVFELANGNAFIETQTDKKSGYGFETIDDYNEVLDKISEAIK